MILNIETSSKNCSVSISSNGNLISNFDLEEERYRHSELLTYSIQDILNKNQISIKELSAVALGIGPGSFTGLRIGFSVAKGLCYPHGINLIGISSLKILANSVNNNGKNVMTLINDKDNFFYLSTFDKDLSELTKPKIQLIDSSFLESYVNKDYVIIVNDSKSYNYIKSNNNKIKLIKKTISSVNMIELSQDLLIKKRFEDLAYFEPLYVKKPYVN
jgi:tRNA threonylcarbamoyladenosine biosynthesis protein TsaB|tara:strand:+ start:151 stop:801 length:651 start_codon:yes stop_codon:yes gene_type:complete